jgi:hypothetical protein
MTAEVLIWSENRSIGCKSRTTVSTPSRISLSPLTDLDDGNGKGDKELKNKSNKEKKRFNEEDPTGATLQETQMHHY